MKPVLRERNAQEKREPQSAKGITEWVANENEIHACIPKILQNATGIVADVEFGLG